ncbi:response regulator [Aurantivibrio plasticivorans]
MLTAPELKIVTETLSKRRAWLIKNSRSNEIGYNEIEQYKASAQLLSDALNKIEAACTDASSSGSDSIDFSHLRVLIAEDDNYSADLLKEILTDLKITNLELASDGNQALAKIFQAEEGFDLVLCDWNMPGKTGLEVHQLMRADARYAKTIFMLVSAVSEGEQIRTAIQQGVNDYVVKPVDEDILKKKISRAFAQPAEQ